MPPVAHFEHGSGIISCVWHLCATIWIYVVTSICAAQVGPFAIASPWPFGALPRLGQKIAAFVMLANAPKLVAFEMLTLMNDFPCYVLVSLHIKVFSDRPLYQWPLHQWPLY